MNVEEDMGEDEADLVMDSHVEVEEEPTRSRQPQVQVQEDMLEDNKVRTTWREM